MPQANLASPSHHTIKIKSYPPCLHMAFNLHCSTHSMNSSEGDEALGQVAQRSGCLIPEVVTIRLDGAWSNPV